MIGRVDPDLDRPARAPSISSPSRPRRRDGTGVDFGATAASRARHLSEIGSDRGARLLDTFSGHIDKQVAGAPRLARWVTDRHGGASVRMSSANTVPLPPRLPWPLVAPRRMAAGGIVLVDDRTDDQARWSYDRFIAEMGPGPARSRSARA